MKVLFIGGTGVISSAVSQLAIERGIELYLFNRGQSQRPTPQGAQVIHGDIRDKQAAAAILRSYTFDSVVDWIAFTAEQAQADIELFRDRTGQYIFISSASVYQKPLAALPITESTPLANPYWKYSQDKIACENLLVQAYRETRFPMTIVRPSHTYDRTNLPLQGGYAAIDRMRKGKKVVVHGDGTSLWVMTHHQDFAKGFVGLLGNPHAIGDSFHITSDDVLTWNQIFELLGRAAGVEPKMLHVASESLARHFATYNPRWGDGLIGDRQWSVVFDNTKIKRVVPGFVATIPFSQGAREIIAYYDADPARQVVDPKLDELFDRIVATYEGTLPQ